MTFLMFRFTLLPDSPDTLVSPDSSVSPDSPGSSNSPVSLDSPDFPISPDSSVSHNSLVSPDSPCVKYIYIFLSSDYSQRSEKNGCFYL